MPRTLFPVLAIVAAVVAVAGCGSSNKSSTSSGNAAAPASTAPASSAKGEQIAVKDTKLGKILVDEEGHVMYLFEADKSTKSTCSGACAADWPPVVTSGKPVAETGAQASMLGTTSRGDGKTQVTYGGHPLYYFALDKQPGQTNGQGMEAFGAEWYVVGAAGKKVESGETSGKSSDSSNSGKGGLSGY
jgi:predicted lipoprotein with Yx(FWY)xxD motif